MICKATISIPLNPYEGYVGRIFLTNGNVIRVMSKQLCEEQEVGGGYTWDYFPFESKEACKAAVRKRIAEIRRKGH